MRWSAKGKTNGGFGPCGFGAKPADAASVGKALALTEFKRKFSRISASGMTSFVDGLEPTIWWYRAAVLFEGALLTATTAVCADQAFAHFGFTALLSLIFAVVSCFFAPFVGDGFVSLNAYHLCSAVSKLKMRAELFLWLFLPFGRWTVSTSPRGLLIY